MVVPSVGFDINKAAKSDPALAKQIISIPDSELYLVANDLTADKYEKKNKKTSKSRNCAYSRNTYCTWYFNRIKL